MIKSVIIETATTLPDNLRRRAVENNINILKLNNLDDYVGNEDYVMEYSDDLSSTEIDNFFSRALEQPLIIGHTKRLLIREICPSDANAVIGLFNDFPEAFSTNCGIIDDSIAGFILQNKSMKNVEAIPQNLVKKEEHTLRQYAKYQYNFYNYGLWLLSLADNSEKIIGIAGLYGTNPVMISYALEAEYRNQGYCNEAIQFVLNYANTVLNIGILSAEIADNNYVSLHLANKYNIKIIK